MPGWEPDDGNALVDDRRKIITRAEKIDLTGELMVDILRQDIPFPHDVEIFLKLHRNTKEFVLNAENVPKGTSYEISITSANLLITRFNMSPSMDLYQAFNNDLSYVYDALDPKHFVIPAGVAQINQELSTGILPLGIMVVFLSQEAFNGSLSHNPFFFHHHLIKSINLRLNDIISIPHVPYTFELGNVSLIEPTPATAVTRYIDPAAEIGLSDSLSKPSERKRTNLDPELKNRVLDFFADIQERFGNEEGGSKTKTTSTRY